MTDATPSAELIAMRELALQKIGRNLVNFQRMEAMLKYLLKFSNFSLPISQLAPHFQGADRELRKKSMGNLVGPIARVLHQPHGQPPAPLADSKEVWVTYSFTLEGEGADPAKWRKTMNAIVRERNTLVHRTAAECNLATVESCRALCDALDAQRERTLQPYQHLEELVRAIKESHRELATANFEQLPPRTTN
jgi:hypothetical protein